MNCQQSKTALTSIDLTTKSGAYYQTRVQDVSDLMQRLTDVWAGVEQSELPMTLTSGACIASRDTSNIHGDEY